MIIKVLTRLILAYNSRNGSGGMYGPGISFENS
jgi:hypothetical protein